MSEEMQMGAPDEMPAAQYDETIRGRGPGGPPKRKKKRYLVRLLVVLLLCGGVYLVMTSSVFAIKDITVVKTGAHYTAADVIRLSGVKVGDNLFKTSVSKAGRRLLSDPWIGAATVKRALPNGLSIAVEERKEAFAVQYGGRFASISSTGVALQESGSQGGLPLVSGLEITACKVGQKLSVKDEKALQDAQSLIAAMKKDGVAAGAVQLGVPVSRVYINSHFAIEGVCSDITSGMDSVRLVLDDLKTKKISQGVIRVSGSGTCAFNPVFTQL